MSKLGSLLVREGLLSEADRRMIHRESGTHRGSFARSILALGVVDENELAALFAAKTSYRIAPKNLAAEIESDAMGLIPPHILTWLDVIPVRKANGVLHVAMTDPTDREAIAQLEFFSGMIIKPIIASFSMIGAALKEHLASHVDFGRSEFEEFIKNHSVSATKFATKGIVTGAAAKAAPSEGSVESVSQDDDVELMVDEPDLTPEPAAATEDDISIMQDDSAELAPVEELSAAPAATEEMLHDDSDDHLADEALSDTGGDIASSEIAASPDLDIDLGDVSFDLDDEGNEKPKEAAAAAPTANMDDLLAGDDLGAEPAAAATEALPDLAEATIGEDVSLSLDDDLGLEPEAELGADAGDTGAPNSLTPEDLLIPEDITGDLGASASVAATEEVAAVDDELDLGTDVADLALGGDLEAAPTGGDDVSLGEDLAAPSAGEELSLDSDLGLEDLDLGGLNETPAADAAAPTTEAPLDELLGDVGLDESTALNALSDDLDIAESAAQPNLDPQMDDIDLESMNIDDGEVHADPSAAAAELADVELNLESLDDLSVSDMAVEPVIEASSGENDLSAKAHPGIAALNRALVNLALLSDSKKAFARMADAAGQAGIESGAVIAFDQNAIKPGVLWSRSGGNIGSIADAPAGISNDAAKNAIAKAAGKDGWMSLSEGLTDAQVKGLTSGWPDAQQIPTHILVRTLPSGKSILGFAKFAGESNHEGLKESFAELVKAAGAKI